LADPGSALVTRGANAKNASASTGYIGRNFDGMNVISR
jgi:hypothetical protein